MSLVENNPEKVTHRMFDLWVGTGTQTLQCMQEILEYTQEEVALWKEDSASKFVVDFPLLSTPTFG